jgi:multiple sugar transport system permease protein
MNQRSVRKLQDTVAIILFLSPLLIGMVMFSYYPLIAAFYNSLTNMNIANPAAAKFIGAQNYLNLVGNTEFFRALANSLLYTAGKLVIQLPLGLSLAMLANQAVRGKTLLRGALFAPLVASEVVIAVIFNTMYFPDFGLFNAILRAVGLPTQGFIVSSTQALPSILVVMIWMDVGFTVLLYLAGLQSIPMEFSEAARIDGANEWDNFRYITLPLLKRTTLLCAFMATISGFRVFTPVYILTRGGPQDATVSAIYFVYEQAFKFLNMGPASAMAVAFILILAGITLVQGRVLRTEFEY